VIRNWGFSKLMAGAFITEGDFTVYLLAPAFTPEDLNLGSISAMFLDIGEKTFSLMLKLSIILV
jgi:hypothetical protein